MAKVVILKMEVTYMQVFNVKYVLDDEEVSRLEKLVEEYKQKGFETNKFNLFDTIMSMGSKTDIDTRFKLHEWKVGLREDFK